MARAKPGRCSSQSCPPTAGGGWNSLPARAGVYLYHSQVVAAANLQAGLYSGQAGALLVEPRNHSRPLRSRMGGCTERVRALHAPHRARLRSWLLHAHRRTAGCPDTVTPLRARTGERVLLHVLNAGATESYSLELPGHYFEVTALDGCPVPVPTRVAALQLSPGERVSAYVVVNQPTGGWCASRSIQTRTCGLRLRLALSDPDETRSLVLTRHDAARSGFNRWSVNGASFSAADPQPAFRVQHGSRYRLKIHNTSDEIIPLHLQRHRLQIVAASGRSAEGRGCHRGPAAAGS